MRNKIINLLTNKNVKVTTSRMDGNSEASVHPDRRPQTPGDLPGGWNDEISDQRCRPTLVSTGENVGDSRVIYRGHNMPLHLFTKDFFISVVGLQTWTLLSLVALFYLFIFFFWSFIWWLIVRFYPGCLYGASNYVESLVFAVVTQMTIGYGNTGPQACWAASILLIIQSVIALVLEAVVLGIVFARISHPHQRSKSIFMSDKAVVARRDGILKFMFRVADVRTTQVVEPKVKAYLYTWGDGRITAEGENIPVRVEPLEVDYIDGMLLLPLIIEHTIDERSPLCGHTASSLAALNAEIVVTFEGTTEMGNPFMARRSYVPEEIYWGCQFSNVVVKRRDPACPYEVRLNKFHTVELQAEMPNVHPTELSNIVVNRAKRTVPYPLLGENTLVLSDVLCVTPNSDGQLTLVCRVGDTYPNQMLEITGKMFLYRWKEGETVGKEPAPAGEAFDQYALEVGYKSGIDRLHLRLPSLLTHVIDESSPLATWLQEGGLENDLDSEIVVVINAYMNVNNSNVLRQRTYTISHHLRYGFGFVPMVRPPKKSRDGKPRVRWHFFHKIQPVNEEAMQSFPSPPSHGRNAVGTEHNESGALSIAPESHANVRSLQGFPGGPGFVLGPSEGSKDLSDLHLQDPNLLSNDFTVISPDLQRYAAAVGGNFSRLTGSPRADVRHTFSFLANTTEANDSMPHPAALHPSLPGPDRFRMTDEERDQELANDYTIILPDLSRYTARVAATSLPKGRSTAAAAAAAGFDANAQGSQPARGQETQESIQRSGTSGAIRPPSALGLVEKSGSSAATSTEAATQGTALQDVRPVEETVMDSSESGPMHFSTSKTRKGAKSLKEISSLFTDEQEGDDDDIEKKGGDNV